MDKRTWHMMEISRLVQEDPQGNRLLDDFLASCFDNVCPPEWALLPEKALPSKTTSEAFVRTLERLNEHLERRHGLPLQAMRPPKGRPINLWAEDITMQILTNSPF